MAHSLGEFIITSEKALNCPQSSTEVDICLSPKLRGSYLILKGEASADLELISDRHPAQWVRVLG
jgi:hypothetical protein